METLTRAKDATYNGLTTGASYVASGATTAKDMGKVMKAAQEKTQGRLRSTWV